MSLTMDVYSPKERLEALNDIIGDLRADIMRHYARLERIGLLERQRQGVRLGPKEAHDCAVGIIMDAISSDAIDHDEHKQLQQAVEAQ